MSGRVGVVAVGQTRYQPNRSDVNEEELAYGAIREVLEATGFTLFDIHSVVAFLPGMEASYIHGTVYYIDGGIDTATRPDSFWALACT